MSTETPERLPAKSDVTLSSSKFAAALGLSPWMSRARLWRLLTNRVAPDPSLSRMKWGQHNEHKAVAAVEAATGLLFERTGDAQESIQPEGSWLSATPDGVASDGLVGLEVKCPEKECDFIRSHYMPQIQGQIHVCGFESVIFATWTHETLHCWRVPRDDVYFRMVYQGLLEFRRFVEDDVCPPRLKSRPVLPDVHIEKL